VPLRAEITPAEPDPVRTGEGSELTPRCLTIATSDSGGGAGIQADLKAFARAGCHGSSALVALTAQNTVGVTAIHVLPPQFVIAQLEAVFDDIGVDAAKTGMLFSARLIEAVADFLERHPVPLVVDPVMVASSGAQLLEAGAVETLVARLLPLATVVTPNLAEAQVLAGVKQQTVTKFDAASKAKAADGSAILGKQQTVTKSELAERIHALGAAAVIVTGGHGDPVDHFFDGTEHTEIPVVRREVTATHGAGCTHSATLCAALAQGQSLEDAARTAALVASEAVAHGLTDVGSGDGPVDVFNLTAASLAMPLKPDPIVATTSDLTRVKEEAREHDRVHAFDRR
jgi:hydroxymethylpyrimidine/phosphomethylpyrimidine kinase